MYAAGVWGTAAKKLTIQNKLNTVQRGFAQKICRSYRTVSLNSALLLSGLLPLDIRIQEAEKLFKAKRGLETIMIADRTVEQNISFLQAPHPSKTIEIEFECIKSNKFEEHIRNNLKDSHIYTDGSKIEGKVGAAITHWKNGKEIKTGKYKLESFCTVFQAELYALLEAMKAIHRIKEEVTHIYSDSRSSLELLRQSGTYHPLAFEIKNYISKIKEEGKVIKFYWIEAHSGIKGNERADHLAKEAALYAKTATRYDKCPLSYIKKILREKSIEQWNMRYNEGETAKVTKLFMPNVISAYKIIRKTTLTPTLVQVLTGHGGFSYYLHKFKCKDCPSCICDPNAIENVEHIIFDCPIFLKQRTELEIKINNKININTISDIFSNDKIRQIVIDFCTKITESVIKRNKTK